ncbi:hypothetical protein COZ22_01855 [bacterium (Candidatus Howlettbacteria) CG_4_10_14_3_um_filter_37_10]|nr:MAG: hypothetical protein COX25_02450 [bacterium (Candidatus Howlettbacteria) CG23_combo_of_CG06-09_8_20_14_all_37_9]PIX99725.1 MAG: hypothetical protein COZ22_01855 [bacterium (Candidatus Howlettbacteria) CG_4_10_14_3_um_filter_37_10]PJB06697.1 MAG: hypothetical protein CO123_01530 [bacterium (Candidatus Howlettbacteria) CG_4_9_14_3_um_filter_37_10]
MSSETIIILAVISGIFIVGLAAVVIFLLKKLDVIGSSLKNDAAITMMNQNMQGMQQKIDQTTRDMNDRLDRAANVIGHVSKELGSLQEIGRNMKGLQDFLKSPKLRGNIGEAILKDLLRQFLPKENFALQYKFKNGATVDAIIRIDNGLIPVDAKFPIDNFTKMFQAEAEAEKLIFAKEFTRDVKKHIDDISKKYILPGEGTVDFAVMYIPSEAIYYEIAINSGDLDRYALTKKVFLVSPNSFSYLVRTILVGLEGKKITEASKQILAALHAIRQDNDKFGQSLSVLNRHITNAKSSMEGVANEYEKLSSKIESTLVLKGENEIEKALETIE